MNLLRYPAVPLILGLVLGPLLELGIRRTLIASSGDFGVFIERPISLIILLITCVIVLWPLLSRLLRRNRAAMQGCTREPREPASSQPARCLARRQTSPDISEAAGRFPAVPPPSPFASGQNKTYSRRHVKAEQNVNIMRLRGSRLRARGQTSRHIDGRSFARQ